MSAFSMLPIACSSSAEVILLSPHLQEIQDDG